MKPLEASTALEACGSISHRQVNLVKDIEIKVQLKNIHVRFVIITITSNWSMTLSVKVYENFVHSIAHNHHLHKMCMQVHCITIEDM